MHKRKRHRRILALCTLIIVSIFAGVLFVLATTASCAQRPVVKETSSAVDLCPAPSLPVRHPTRVCISLPDAEELPGPASEPSDPIPLYGEELYQSYVDEIAALYFPSMDVAVVKALIYTESRYQPDVSSSAGAVGLMQVIPYYHAWRMEKYGMSDIWDPYTNILVGMDLLDELYQKYGNWYDVLYFYSGGDASYPNLIASRSNQYR